MKPMPTNFIPSNRFRYNQDNICLSYSLHTMKCKVSTTDTNSYRHHRTHSANGYSRRSQRRNNRSLLCIFNVLPEEMILSILSYLSPSGQSKISRTNHTFHNLCCEAAHHQFYDTFGSITPNKLKHRQIIGILQNVYLAQHNITKAKKILCWAASKGYIKFIQGTSHKQTLLCLKGIINLRASQFSHGMTPLYLATRQQHLDIVEYLITLPNIRLNEICSSYSHTISHVAASKGYLDILQCIGTHSSGNNLKWDIDRKDGIDSYSALMTATIHGHYSCCSYLIECGANVNFKDKNEMSLLYHAAENGYVHICELLLNHDASINDKSKAGKSPLFIACDQGWDDVVTLLVQYGANVRLKSSRGKLPLYVAAEKGFKNIVKILLEHSVVSDLFTMTSYGTTPFFIASKQMDKSIKALFKRFCIRKQNVYKSKPSLMMNDYDDIVSEESSISTQSSVQKAVEESQKWLKEKERKKSKPRQRIFKKSRSDQCIVNTKRVLYTDRLPTPLFAHEIEDFQEAQSEQLHHRKRTNIAIADFECYNGGIGSITGKRKMLKPRYHRTRSNRHKIKKKKNRINSLNRLGKGLTLNAIEKHTTNTRT
eukprot:616182_1